MKTLVSHTMNLVRGAVMSRLLVTFVCLLCLHAPAAADGKVFRSATAVVPMVDQEAIIFYSSGTQVLAIRTRADASTAKGEPLAWVVPVPAVPDLLTSTPGVFDTARALTMPRLLQGHNAGPGWLMLGVSVFGLLLAATARYNTAVPKREQRLVLVMLVVVGFFIAVGVLMPALATSRGSTDALSANDVEVLKRERIGTLDVAVVCARDGQGSARSLAAWLKDAGCSVPPAAEPALADYAARGWVFVAARLADTATAARLEPTPLVLRFPTPIPVYPMKLTGVGNGPLGLELCVIAPGTASAPGMDVARSSPLRSDIDYSSNEVPLVHEGLKSLADFAGIGKGAWITRLTGHLTPEQQSADVSITINAGRRVGEALYTPAGARRTASQWGAAVTAVGLLALTVALGVIGVARVRGIKWVLASVAAGFVVAAAISFLLPQYHGEIKVGRRFDRLQHSMVYGLGEARSNTLKDVRDLIASRRAAGLEPFVSIPPEGDVPGGYVLSEGKDGDVWVDLFDQYGSINHSYPVLMLNTHR